MAITVTHPFVSVKPDGTDSSLVQPSNWNDNHSVIGTLDVANGGTGASTASTARTNLGLGTIATQDANNVAITGGSMSGVTLTSLDANTTFQDNADPTKQMQFQLSSITGGQTSVLTVPDTDGTLVLEGATQTLTNKTLTSPTISGGSISGITDLALADGGTGASLADPNADRIMFWDDSAGAVTWLTAGTGLTITDTTITASGTGDVVGPASSTDNAIVRFDGTTGKLVQNSAVTVDDTTGTLTFTGTSARIKGDFSNATVASRVLVQTTTTNSYTTLGIIPSGTSNFSYLQLFNSSSPDNSSTLQLEISSSGTSINAAKIGTGTYLPLQFTVGGSARFQIGTDGQWGIGGATYGSAGQPMVSGGASAAPAWSKVVLTQPATAATLTIADNKTFTVNNTLTLSGNDGSTLIIGGGGTLGSAAYTASTDYAVAAKGVTNGDSHDHSGGDGAQIAYANLSGTPDLTVYAKKAGDADIDMNNYLIKEIKTATFNSQAVLSTTTGSVNIDWSAAQNYKQDEPTGTITYTFTNPPGPCHLQLLIDSDGGSVAQTINWPTLTWIGATWTGANNKKAIINLWFDGTNYFAQGANQV